MNDQRLKRSTIVQYTLKAPCVNSGHTHLFSSNQISRCVCDQCLEMACRGRTCKEQGTSNLTGNALLLRSRDHCDSLSSHLSSSIIMSFGTTEPKYGRKSLYSHRRRTHVCRTLPRWICRSKWLLFLQYVQATQTRQQSRLLNTATLYE